MTSETTGPPDNTAPPPLHRATRPGVVLILVALAVCVTGAVFAPVDFWAAWLTGSVYWIGTSMGAVGIALVHRMTGGRWGLGIRRELHAAVKTTPVVVLTLVPLAFGAPFLYVWAGRTGGGDLGAAQQIYLAPEMVLTRTVIQAAAWILIAWWILRDDGRLARDPEWRSSARRAALLMLVLILTLSSFGVDAMMSLTPTWSSTQYPLIQVLGFAVTGLAVVIIARTLSGVDVHDPAQTVVTHDLGNLLQAFNLLWVYLAFTQYFIIWGGNLPFEVDWYLERSEGIAFWATLVIVSFHFVVPFALLLSRELKQDPRRVANVAALLLVMRLVDLSWTILPSAGATVLPSLLLVPAGWILIGGVWLLLFARFHRRAPVEDLAPEYTQTLPPVTGTIEEVGPEEMP